MKRDVHDEYGVAPDRIRVIHNGIDLRQYRPTPDPSVLRALRINPDVPYRLVCRPDHPPEGDRSSRQRYTALPPRRSSGPLRRCAGHTGHCQRDDSRRSTARARESSHPIIWIREMLPKEKIITLYTHAAIFRVPVGLRAVRDHQSRSHGVRDAGRRVRSRRHSGGRRPRGDGTAGRAGGVRAHRGRAETSGAVLEGSRRMRSIRCSTIRTCERRWPDGREPAWNSSSVGRASLARRWSFMNRSSGGTGSGNGSHTARALIKNPGLMPGNSDVGVECHGSGIQLRVSLLRSRSGIHTARSMLWITGWR